MNKKDETAELKYFLRLFARLNWLDLHELIIKTTKELSKKMLCERGTIYLRDDDSLYSIFAQNVLKSKPILVKFGEGFVGRCAQSGKTINIKNAAKSSRHKKIICDFLIKEIVSVPVKSHSEVIGVIQLINKKNKTPFNRKDIDFLEKFAFYFSPILLHAKTVERLERERNESLLRLSRTTESRDTDTGKHIERIQYYSEAIAKALKLPSETISIISKSSRLHDIGKIGILDRILLKPGKLTEEEREEMKKHTIIGAHILLEENLEKNNRNSNYFGCAAKIAKHHHEKYDGTGYPCGLKGEEIPLEARITAVADVFDALTTKRPYKEPWDPKDALEEIIKNSETHFDPEIVKTFLESRVAGVIKEIYLKYKD